MPSIGEPACRCAPGTPAAASTTVTAASPARAPGRRRRDRRPRPRRAPRAGRRRAAAAATCVSGSPNRQLNSSTLRAVGGQHQPGEQAADERRAAPRELVEHRPVDLLDELVDARRADGDRRVRAHAAGVRPGVAVADRACSPARRRAARRAARRRARTATPLRPRAAPRSRPRRRARRRRAAPRRAPPASGRRRRPCPAARPSAFTTQGASRDRERLRGRHAGRVAARPWRTSSTPRSGPRPRSARRRRCPPARSRSATPATSGASGPITTRSASSVVRQREQPVRVVGAHRMAAAERGDPRVAGRRVQLGQLGLWRARHASACSRPPEPTTTTCTRRG